MISAERSAEPAMRASITVRNATIADLSSIRDIYQYHVLNSLAAFDEIPPDLGEFEAKFSSIGERGLPFLVAQLAGEVVGYSFVTPYRGRSAHRFSVEDSIYVRQDMCGCGVGKMLLGELVNICAKLGYRQMIAIVGNSENIASIRLHETLGFHQVGTLQGVGFKFERWVNTVIMQRKLGEGVASLPLALPMKEVG